MARHSRVVGLACTDDAFVACGSDDCAVHVWHHASGRRVLRLAGHSGRVNAVAWCPRRAGVLVSVSDDGTVRVWGADSTVV